MTWPEDSATESRYWMNLLEVSETVELDVVRSSVRDEVALSVSSFCFWSWNDTDSYSGPTQITPSCGCSAARFPKRRAQATIKFRINKK